MTGSLQVKNNKFYAVVNVYENNKRKPKWIYTGYTVPGNKKKAEQFLRRVLIEYEEKLSIVRSDVTFSEYVRYWLKTVQRNLPIKVKSKFRAKKFLLVEKFRHDEKTESESFF